MITMNQRKLLILLGLGTAVYLLVKEFNKNKAIEKAAAPANAPRTKPSAFPFSDTIQSSKAEIEQFLQELNGLLKGQHRVTVLTLSEMCPRVRPR